MELISTLFLGFISAVIVSYISFRYFRKRIKSFKGFVSTESEVSKLFKFLYMRSNEIFLLDINLSQRFADEFKKDYRFSKPDFNDGNIVIGGLTLEIRKEGLEDVLIDMRPTSNRIKGYFKIIHISGPQQGWFIVILRSVQLESIYNNL